MYDEGRRSFAPVSVGDEVDLTIEAEGAKGDGIAKIKGFVIFVPGGKQGETVKVKITKVFRKMAFAEVLGQGNVKTEPATPEGEVTEETTTDDEGDYQESEE